MIRTSHAYRVAEAAALLGVSDDTVRRWASAGRLVLRPGENGRLVADGAELAALARERAAESTSSAATLPRTSSPRNRFMGIVTKVTSDTVMSQVELQAGPFRVVSLMSTEAVLELGLEPGSLAVATVKATAVAVELTANGSDSRLRQPS